ncbi:hypothetical protein CR513_07163, partial [Mucuna pruriens]
MADVGDATGAFLIVPLYSEFLEVRLGRDGSGLCSLFLNPSGKNYKQHHSRNRDPLISSQNRMLTRKHHSRLDPFKCHFQAGHSQQGSLNLMFWKVEINIPLLDAIKQIPKYAKFL